MSETTIKWIAESESWQTFIDFRMPGIAGLQYDFLKRADDFYIALIGQLYDLLEGEVPANGMLAIAKGLEIYSLQHKKDNFNGVNQFDNMILAAGLYYLSDYASSACILANLYTKPEDCDHLSAFILEFLQRKLSPQNPYSSSVLSFLQNGNLEDLDTLIVQIETEKEIALVYSPRYYTICLVAGAIAAKFREDNLWTDLLESNNVEHWKSFVQRSITKAFPIWSLFPSQKAALQKGILGNFNSIALRTPTSSGKTAICELLIYNEVKKNPNVKILYLAPFRALAAELKESFGKNLRRLGIRSRTIYGGDIPSASQRQLIQNVSLLISTPEKFIALENSFSEYLDDFTLIICDEGHLLNDFSRGLSYELLLARLKNSLVVSRRFLFISALIPNINVVNSWLGGTAASVVESDYRATELEYAFLRPNPDNVKISFLDFNPFKESPYRYHLDDFLKNEDFHIPGKRLNKPRTYSYSSNKVKAVAIALKSLHTGSVALFTPNKGGNTGVTALAEEMLQLLSSGANFPNPLNFIKSNTTLTDIAEYFKIHFGEGYPLCRLVEIGALYHHGDLPQNIREVVEDAVRSEDIRLVICNNTLAEGVNLPIRTIVVASTKRYNAELKRPTDIELGQLKNLVGRAGRAGKETKGLIIVTNPGDFSAVENVIKNRNLEPVHGRLFEIMTKMLDKIRSARLVMENEVFEAQDAEFRTWLNSIDLSIIDLLAEEIEPDYLEQELQSIFSETFAIFQANDEQAGTLLEIVGLRSAKLRPFVERGEFSYIKQSGSNLSLYEEVTAILNIHDPNWNQQAEPTSSQWLDFIVDQILLNIPSVEEKLQIFNAQNDVSLTSADIKSVLEIWLNGGFYNEFSSYFDNSIDKTLRFIQNFIGYTCYTALSVTIRNLQLRLTAPEFLPEHVVNFPVYLQHGIKATLQLNLMEIGFNDRIAIMTLADVIEFDVDSDILGLEQYLIDNHITLTDQLADLVPNIVFKKILQTFSYLTAT
jgi:helicase